MNNQLKLWILIKLEKSKTKTHDQFKQISAVLEK